MRVRLIIAAIIALAGAAGTWWTLQTSQGGAIIFGISVAALAIAVAIPGSPRNGKPAKATSGEVSPAVYAATRGPARPGGPH